MALRTIVKVGNITNLSDARYCAGMGVEMLGFSVIEGQPAYISPTAFQEIRGWISGPAIVAQIEGAQSSAQISDILQHYAPDYLELTTAELEFIDSDSMPPLLVHTNQSPSAEYSIAYLVVNETQLKEVADPARCLVTLDSTQSLDQVLEAAVGGIVLSGTAEVRPGFKEYGELADVLEQLEVD